MIFFRKLAQARLRIVYIRTSTIYFEFSSFERSIIFGEQNAVKC